MSILRQAVAVALQVFEVYSPAFFLGIVGCKVVLGARPPSADVSDVVADLSGENIDMISVPRIISTYAAAFGKSRNLTPRQKKESQQ
jgi:hypothetical protein